MGAVRTGDSLAVQGDWSLEVRVDRQLEDELTEKLVAFNRAAAPIVDVRFEPEHLKSEPVQVFALTSDATVIGGCLGQVERIWHWLTVDLMWVDREWAGRGVGASLLAAVEDEARSRGCRWSDVTTFDFQAPGFYRKQGYIEYRREARLPAGPLEPLLPERPLDADAAEENCALLRGRTRPVRDVGHRLGEHGAETHHGAGVDVSTDRTIAMSALEDGAHRLVHLAS